MSGLLSAMMISSEGTQFSLDFLIQGRREDRGPLNLEPLNLEPLNLEPLNFERARAAARAPSRE